MGKTRKHLGGLLLGPLRGFPVRRASELQTYSKGLATSEPNLSPGNTHRWVSGTRAPGMCGGCGAGGRLFSFYGAISESLSLKSRVEAYPKWRIPTAKQKPNKNPVLGSGVGQKEACESKATRRGSECAFGHLVQFPGELKAREAERRGEREERIDGGARGCSPLGSLPGAPRAFLQTRPTLEPSKHRSGPSFPRWGGRKAP